MHLDRCHHFNLACQSGNGIDFHNQVAFRLIQLQLHMHALLQQLLAGLDGKAWLLGLPHELVIITACQPP